MPEYLAPGVYVEEIEIGGKPIEGVGTTTAGFLGETERGPIEPTLVTGFEHFKRLYGEYTPKSYLPYAVEGFFSNGGKRCFIARIVGENTKPAQADIDAEGGGTIPVEAADGGAWGNRIGVKVDTASLQDDKNPLVAKLFRLWVFYWKDVPPGAPQSVVDPLDRQKARDPNRRDPLLREVFDNLSPDPRSPDYYVKRINSASDLIRIEDPKPGARPVPPAKAAAAKDVVEKARTAANDLAAKAEKAASDAEAAQAAADSAAPADRAPLADKANAAKVAAGKAADAAKAAAEKADKVGKDAGDASMVILLKDGSDGDPVDLKHYEGNGDPTAGAVSGLNGFATVDEITMLCAPDENRSTLAGLTDQLVEQCEVLKDRFAILQASDTPDTIANLRPPTDSKYAAFYYPWITIMDPVSGTEKKIPPGGHIAGIYARTDIERGVHKAPANEVVRGASGLQFQITKGDQDILNPRGVNCIRVFLGRGIRVWGARTISSDPLWKYVNVRRLMIYLEESIDEGTQWVVFEPNDLRLWARVRQTISDFLTRVWRDGALFGATPEQAFFVKCDETTMTPDDIENGRLICLIGVAPVRPAEFVIFRIAQWRSGSAISE